jgi:hypothetical protein
MKSLSNFNKNSYAIQPYECKWINAADIRKIQLSSYLKLISRLP